VAVAQGQQPGVEKLLKVEVEEKSTGEGKAHFTCEL
jgi:hypothetical protein